MEPVIKEELTNGLTTAPHHVPEGKSQEDKAATTRHANSVFEPQLDPEVAGEVLQAVIKSSYFVV